MNLALKKEYKSSTKLIDEYHHCMTENWKKARAQSFLNPWPEYERLNRMDKKRIGL